MNQRSDGNIVIEDATCDIETDNALRVHAPDLEGDQWVPKSQIHDDSEVYKAGGSGDLIVSEWIAKEKAWI